MTASKAAQRAFLRTLVMFGGLSDASMEGLLAIIRARRLAAGERLFDAGQPCRGFYAVQTGMIRLYRIAPDGHQQTVHLIPPGRSFAEAAMLHFGRYPVSAEAIAADNELIEFPTEAFRSLLATDAEIQPAMLSTMCARLHQLIERVEDLTLTRADARLARYLLRLPARRSAEGHEVALPITKSALARSLAIAPETLSRLLRKWSEERVLTVDGSALVLLRPEQLLAAADGEEV